MPKSKVLDEEIPLFNRYQIESQIELAFQREIEFEDQLLLIQRSMTTIDVNSADLQR